MDETVTPAVDEPVAPTVPDKVTLTRAISLPVQECTSADWREFERQICACWNLSTSLANWGAHTLRAHDVVRTPSMPHLPRLQAVDLYALAFGRERERVGRERLSCPECGRLYFPSQLRDGQTPPHRRGKRVKRDCAGGAAIPVPRRVLPVTNTGYPDAAAWEGGKIAAAGLLRRVDRDYRFYRGKIVWTQERRTPEYLYPHPFPVNAQQWECWFEKGRPFVAMSLPGGRVTLRLRNGPRFAHEIRVLKQIADGSLKKLEVKVDGESSRAHCRLVRVKRRGDEPAQEMRLMLRIAYQMEVYRRPPGKVGCITTGREPFLSLTIEGEPHPFTLFAEWVQTWIDDHRRFLDRFANDLKFEKRWPRRARKRRNRRQTRGVDKQDHRMRSFRQQTAHQFVSHAARRGCGRILYDDTDRSFAEEFPWHLLAKEVEDECRVQGLGYRHAARGADMDREEAG